MLLTTLCCVTDGRVPFSASAIAAPVGFKVLDVEVAATTTLGRDDVAENTEGSKVDVEMDGGAARAVVEDLVDAVERVASIEEKLVDLDERLVDGGGKLVDVEDMLVVDLGGSSSSPSFDVSEADLIPTSSFSWSASSSASRINITRPMAITLDTEE